MADADDLFGTETIKPRRTSRRDPGDGLVGALSASSPDESAPAAETVEQQTDRTLAEIETVLERNEPAPRLLSDEQRLKLSQIVDHRISAHKRGRITAEEVRRILLELVANV